MRITHACRISTHQSLVGPDPLLSERSRQHAVRHPPAVFVRHTPRHACTKLTRALRRFVHPPSVAWPPPGEPALPPLPPVAPQPPAHHTLPCCDPLLVTRSVPLTLQMEGGDLQIPTQVQIYAQNHLLAHPLVSPIMGNLRGLPPMLVLVSDMESLRDEVQPQTLQIKKVLVDSWTGGLPSAQGLRSSSWRGGASRRAGVSISVPRTRSVGANGCASPSIRRSLSHSSSVCFH